MIHGMKDRDYISEAFIQGGKSVGKILKKNK